ncbi:MgtC/SapB family protein, partial [Methylocapsa palsarum]
MAHLDPVILRRGVALGIGLLIGTERERRKGEGEDRAPAGLRTFALASLSGAIGFVTGGVPLLSVLIIGVFGLTALAYWQARDEDPGLTTEIALSATTVLGGLAMTQPGLAAGVAVAVTVLLNARSALHGFVRSGLSEGEVRDALIFAAATLIVLPLLPDKALGPFGALNPHAIWIIAILVMGIGAFGHVTVRL